MHLAWHPPKLCTPSSPIAFPPILNESAMRLSSIWYRIESSWRSERMKSLKSTQNECWHKAHFNIMFGIHGNHSLDCWMLCREHVEVHGMCMCVVCVWMLSMLFGDLFTLNVCVCMCVFVIPDNCNQLAGDPNLNCKQWFGMVGSCIHCIRVYTC